MNKETFLNLFPLGSHLCREPMPPMSELKADMAILKKRGFNLVKLQEQWMIDEPEEGHCDFARYEELIEHAASLEMGVYMGLTCEQAPDWLYRKYPDCRMVGRNGQPIIYQAQTPLPADGKPGPCFDHDGAMNDQLRFIRLLVARLGKYENIVVWNTWQEIGYWSETIVGQPTCYCEHTLKAFRSWLRETYADLDALNRAWNMRYRSWEAIQPNRHTQKSCCPQDIAWGTFQDNVRIARTLQARSDAIRAADPYRRPVFAHKAGLNIGAAQDWVYARCQDFLGASAYPAWAPCDQWDDAAQSNGQPHDKHAALLNEMWNGIALKFDYLRSCNAPGNPLWAAEFQGGPVSTAFHKGRVPSPDDIRRWMLTALASGVTAISFWVTRAEIAADELNGFGLLDSAGDTTPRLEEAARIGEVLQRHADVLARPTLVRSEVAIIVDEDNYQVCRLLGQAAEHLPYSVRGWHRLLWDAGVSVDFVAASHLDNIRLDQYKAIVLAFPLVVSDKTTAWLSSYVEQGGNLISDACPGRVTEYGYATRGELPQAVCDLFGVRQVGLSMVREPDNGARWSPAERSWGEYLNPAELLGTGPLNGQHLRANVYVQTFECADSQPLLTYNDGVAGTVRQAGKGRAWLLGTYAGHSGTAYRSVQTALFVRHLLSQCGIGRRHSGELLLRRRVTSDKEIWFVTNPTPHDIMETIDTGAWHVEDLLGEPLQPRGNGVRIDVRSLDVRALVLTRDQPAI
ncbi:MAG: beta-galactosidase [Chloroflexi bacterium]|nr:beta-galactosidase [Chloroflexota bacterium]